MSETGNQPPFRMPCEGTHGAPRIFFGSPWQHAVAPLFYDKYVNITTVPNPAGGAAIPPYERYTPDLSGGDSCEVHHCNPDAAPCAAWLLPLIDNVYSHATGDRIDFAVAHKRGWKGVQARRFWSGAWGYRNMEASNGPDNVQCCGDGVTQKIWRSFHSAPPPGTKYLSLHITAQFLEIANNYDGHGGMTGTTTVSDHTAEISENIDPNSGLLTFAGVATSPNDDRNLALAQMGIGLWTWSEIAAFMTSGPSAPDFTQTVCTDTSITVTYVGGSWDGKIASLTTWDLNAGTASKIQYLYSGSGGTFIITQETIAVSDGSLEYSSINNTWLDEGGPDLQLAAQNTITVTGILGGENTSAAVYADIKNLLALWPLNDDALYPWRQDLKLSAAPLVSRDEIWTQGFDIGFWVKDYGSPIADPGGATIGNPAWTGHTGIVLAPNPLTGTAVVALGGTQTNGDVINSGAGAPFSHTPVISYAMVGTLPPGCSFDATTGIVSGTVSADCTWGITVTITGAVPAVNGAIRGAPKPAGYQNEWDFRYQDWTGCCYTDPTDDSHKTWSWYQAGWGMSVGTFKTNSGCSLPLNATQWTNYFQSVNKPPGAFLFYNDLGQAYYGSGCVSSDAPSGVLDGGALWAEKYAEILELWNSQNFARPAGDDKFLIDENRVYCITNVSGAGAGSTWTLTNPLDGTTPADGTDFSGIWGAPSVGGFYNVASYSGGTITLGAKVYDVPSNWVSKSNNDGGACFGKLRFDTKPSLLGRIGIVPDMAGTTFTFAAAQAAFGMNSSTHQEQVDLYDASMTLIASNVTATRISDTQFSTLDSRPSALWAVIHGAPAWYINDTGPKGDYTVLEWLADLRTAGETTRLTGVLDCSGTQVALPTANVGGGPVTQPFASFSQTPGCLPFVPCSPKVVCISPNGEEFPNGVTYPFPDMFVMDEFYGSKWWGSVQSTMSDLIWQQPHRPCNILPCAQWKMDDLTCQPDLPDDGITYACPGDDDYVDGESLPPVYYFGAPPQVEARLTVPCNYGPANMAGHQTECAPDLPSGVQIGWLSPVTNSTGDVALPPVAPGAANDRGEPNGANTAWNTHGYFCTYGPGCRFGYFAPGC